MIMRDPNNIALTADDVDLGVYQDAMGDGGAGDLMDYASVVQNWGSDAGDAITATPAATRPACPPGTSRNPGFHPTHQIRAPFMVATIVAILILIVVFFPGRE